jgi:putative PEP-CTERM system TPR-repeat lipoprotein
MKPHPLALATALALTAPFALNGCDRASNLTEQEYIQRAKDYEDKGSLTESVIELKNAIQRNPGSAQARLLLGQIYLKIGMGAEAEKELIQAEKLGVNKNSITPLLGEALLLMSEYKRILTEIQPSEQYSNIINGHILQLRGDANFRLGQFGEACNLYQKSLEVNISHPPTFWGLAQCAISNRDVATAKHWLSEALKNKKRQDKTWAYLGNLEQHNKNQQGALVAYGNALRINPQQIDALQGRAVLHMADGNLEAAQADVNRIAQFLPNSLISYYSQALLNFEQKEYAGAREHLHEIFKITKDHMPSVLVAGATDFALGSYEQAEAHLARFLAASPNHVYARRLLAATLIKQNNVDKAVETLAPLIQPGTQDSQALVLASEAYRAKNEPVKASELLAKASAIDPRNASIQFQLGFSHLVSGNIDLGINELEKAASFGQDSQETDSLLAVALINQKKYDKALNIITRLEDKFGKKPAILVLKGNALLGKKELLGARRSYELALSIDPRHFPAVANLAQLDMLDKKPELAQNRLEKFLEKDKSNLQAIMALASLAAAKKADQDYVGWLEKAIKAEPKALQPRASLVKHLLTRNEIQKALIHANDAVNLNPDNPNAYEILGSVQLATNDITGALNTFTKITRLSGNSPAPYTKLALVQMGANKLVDARNTLETALKLKHDHEPSLDALIQIDMKNRKPERALSIARQIQSMHPHSARGFEREGDIHLSQNNSSLAIRAYEQALSKNVSSHLFIKSHRAHVLAGDAKPEEMLKDWLVKYPQDILVRFHAAEYYASISQNQDAINNYNVLLKHAPNHSIALNNLAILYQNTGDKRALITAEQAYKINPSSPAIMDTLGWILSEHGQVIRGSELIEKALTKLPNNPTIRYHQAMTLAQKGDKAQARIKLEALLREVPEFPQAREAKLQIMKW